jgi:hypothetical protein
MNSPIRSDANQLADYSLEIKPREYTFKIQGADL